MKLYAPAKINIALDIKSKRPDNYHEISTIMQTISLYDEITVKKSDVLSVKTGNELIPDGEKNIAYVAAKAFFEYTKQSGGADIFIEKKIPFGAGMGGGSSDAATTINALDILYETNLSAQEKINIGKKAGADVPFFIVGGTALAEGIGEIITPLPDFPECNILICKPDFSVETKWVYNNLKLQNSSNHPEIDKIIFYIKNNDLCNIAKNTGNFLENVTIEKYPEITDIKNVMEMNGAEKALMTGSGSAVFGIFGNYDDALKCEKILKNGKNQVFLCKPTKRDETSL